MIEIAKRDASAAAIRCGMSVAVGSMKSRLLTELGARLAIAGSSLMTVASFWFGSVVGGCFTLVGFGVASWGLSRWPPEDHLLGVGSTWSRLAVNLYSICAVVVMVNFGRATLGWM